MGGCGCGVGGYEYRCVGVPYMICLFRYYSLICDTGIMTVHRMSCVVFQARLKLVLEIYLEFSQYHRLMT